MDSQSMTWMEQGTHLLNDVSTNGNTRPPLASSYDHNDNHSSSVMRGHMRGHGDTAAEPLRGHDDSAGGFAPQVQSSSSSRQSVHWNAACGH